MGTRYDEREIMLNDLVRYQNMLRPRGISSVVMYETPEFRDLTLEDIEELHLEAHRWQLGDRFYKIAHTAYGDPDLWWVIAMFNKMPTESHVQQGDILYVPHPLEQILALFRRT